jgi:hypothetical protein
MPLVVGFREAEKTAPQMTSSRSHERPHLGDSDGEDEDDEESRLVDNDEEFADVTIDLEDYDLLLPSSVDAIKHNLASPNIAKKECALHQAQLEMLLHELRRLLRIKSSVFYDKKRNSVGQKGNTRSATKLTSYAQRIEVIASRYRLVRERLLRLDHRVEWQAIFKPLDKKDVRPMEDNKSDVDRSDDDDDDQSDLEAERRARKKRRRVRQQSHREYSWIWLAPKIGKEADGAVDATEEIGEGKNLRIFL